METEARLIDVAEALIKERGFHGFSFQDVADRVGIRKASIHYHFPSKAALGKAVVARYRAALRSNAETATALAASAPTQALVQYLVPIMAFGQVPEDTCLGAALGGEYLSLPPDLRAEIAAFFAEQQEWLSNHLAAGRTAGAYRFDGDPAQLARLILAAVEGAMLIKRTSGDRTYVGDVVDTMRPLLGLV